MGGGIYYVCMITELNERSREIFRFIVDTYLETGQPVGSRTISRAPGFGLSPASIRNTMADLEDLGLLYAPHTSAGRMPTQTGLRLYIDGLMEVGNLTAGEREKIENTCLGGGNTISDVLERATDILSGLCSCASLVVAPKMDNAVRHIQFIPLEPYRVLVVMVMENGVVENRIMDIPASVPPGNLIAASNYLNSRLSGKTVQQAQKEVAEDIRQNRTHLDRITESLVEAGLALPAKAGPGKSGGYMIVRGQSRLLEDVKALEDLHRARNLLGYLEEQEMMLSLIENLRDAEGVQIFIGTENKIFDQSGWSMIIAPYKSPSQTIVGAIGVIGPTRLDYDRIIPMVDYTSRILGKLLQTK